MLSFFPRDVLDEIWALIESVSEGFPTYSSILEERCFQGKKTGSIINFVSTCKWLTEREMPPFTLTHVW